MTDIRDTFRQQGLVRVREGRILGGVAAGLGRRFGLGPWPARVVLLLLLLALPGSSFLIYPVLWILMPKESTGDATVTVTQSGGPAPQTS